MLLNEYKKCFFLVKKLFSELEVKQYLHATDQLIEALGRPFSGSGRVTRRHV